MKDQELEKSGVHLKLTFENKNGKLHKEFRAEQNEVIKIEKVKPTSSKSEPKRNSGLPIKQFNKGLPGDSSSSESSDSDLPKRPAKEFVKKPLIIQNKVASGDKLGRF